MGEGTGPSVDFSSRVQKRGVRNLKVRRGALGGKIDGKSTNVPLNPTERDPDN